MHRTWTSCGTTSTTPASWSRWSTPPGRAGGAAGRRARRSTFVFVTHSIPLSMNEGSGPDGGAYVAQHRSVATEVVERVRQETGRRHAHELVYCSRSGAAHIPWLEPDINDHLERLSDRGASRS